MVPSRCGFSERDSGWQGGIQRHNLRGSIKSLDPTALLLYTHLRNRRGWALTAVTGTVRQRWETSLAQTTGYNSINYETLTQKNTVHGTTP